MQVLNNLELENITSSVYLESAFNISGLNISTADDSSAE
jgi:hypothetical protein